MFFEQHTKVCIQYGKNLVLMQMNRAIRNDKHEGTNTRCGSQEEENAEAARHKKLVETSWDLRQTLRLHRRYLHLLLDGKWDDLL